MSLRHFFVHHTRLQFFMTVVVTICFLSFTIMTQPSFHSVQRRRSLMWVTNLHEISTNLERNNTKVINPIQQINGGFIHEPSQICNKSSNAKQLLLILVKSDASNLAQRMAIRQTWGNVTDKNINVIFLVGYYSIVHELIELEAKTYKDVLQGDFVDIYNNNFNKTVMAYIWSVENCQNTQYLLFVDDDFFVNVQNVVDYLRSTQMKSKHNLLMGNLVPNGKPFRTKSSKWYITLNEYPFDRYPNYLSGGAILVSMNVAKLFKTAFPYVQYNHIDDVYLGMVAKKLNIPLTHDKRFDVEYTSPMHLKDIFASHAYGDHRQLLVMWDVFQATMSVNMVKDDQKT